MAFDAKFVREAFENTGPKNPLRKLTERDRWFISACLVISKREPRKMGENPWEQTAKTAREAASLAKKISQVLNAQHIEPLKHVDPLKSYLGAFQELPDRLETFAVLVGGLLRHMIGKPGHERKMMNNVQLITASEFVRVKTGQYYDEHLAELIQAITFDSDLKDFSGDAIRRKREHLRKAYPLLHAYAAQKARSAGRSGEDEATTTNASPGIRPYSLSKAMGLNHLRTATGRPGQALMKAGNPPRQRTASACSKRSSTKP